jgi:trehalose utilization protein
VTIRLRIKVWNEGVHEAKNDPEWIADTYPAGIHGAIAEGLTEFYSDALITTTTLADRDHGLSDVELSEMDVLLWWGHLAHEEVGDEVVERVQRHVLGGLGLIVPHSGHCAKVFKRLLGTACSLLWRNEGERQLVWTVNPNHPIAKGVENPIVIPNQEMYSEFLGIPEPDNLIFIRSFEGARFSAQELHPPGGKGRIFYFSPGDQEYPVYHQTAFQQVIANRVEWVAQPNLTREMPSAGNPPRSWFG